MHEMNDIFYEKILHKKYSNDIIQTMNPNRMQISCKEAESMIISVRANNFLVFSNEVEISMKADMRIKKKSVSNVFPGNGYNILKSACVFGPNGAGKTCFIQAIKSIRDVILGTMAVSGITPNWYSKNSVCSLGITFYYKDKAYSYDFSYDTGGSESTGEGFAYECFNELARDKYGNERVKEIFLRDKSKGIYRLSGDESASKEIEKVSDDTILIYGLDGEIHPAVNVCRDILTGFASLIDVVSLDDISLDKTIDAFKYNRPIKEKVLHLIKLSDAYIDDCKYIDKSADVQNQMLPGEMSSNCDSTGVSRDDCLNLYLYYNGVPKQIMLTGSNGTKKLIAIASYIIDALDNGRILVVDELDSSLHIAVTRALVALFNSGINYNGQLFFASHEVTLMDCRRLFRKDQIWFVNRRENVVSLYALSEFTSLDDGIRSESDLIERYEQGCFEAVPRAEYMDLAEDIMGSNDGYEQ